MKKKKKVALSFHQISFLAALGFAQCSIFLLPYISYTFYKPLQMSLHITNQQLGLLLTIYGIFEVASFIPGGWLADRFDPRKMITSGLLIIGICCLVAAFFMNYTVYIIVWIVVGIAGNFIYWSSGLKAVRMIGDADEQGKAYGYFYMFVNLLTAAGNAVGVAIIATMSKDIVLGFKYVVLFFALLAFVAAITIWFSLKSHKQTAKITEEKEKITLKDVIFVLKRKEAWYFGIVAFCLYSYTCLATYFTPYFTDVMHLSVASAGAIYVVTGPISAISGLILGTISDFLGSTMKTIISVMVIILVMVLLMLYLTHIPLVGAIAIDLVVAVLSMGIYAIMFASIEEIGMDIKYAGICIGVASFLAYTPDTFIYAMFGAWLDKHGNYGYTMIFEYGVALALVAIIFSVLFYRSTKKNKVVETFETATL